MKVTLFFQSDGEKPPKVFNEDGSERVTDEDADALADALAGEDPDAAFEQGWRKVRGL